MNFALAASTTTYRNVVLVTFVSGDQSGTPNDNFNTISCSSPGNCTAAGFFLAFNGNQEALTQTLSTPTTPTTPITATPASTTAKATLVATGTNLTNPTGLVVSLLSTGGLTVLIPKRRRRAQPLA